MISREVADEVGRLVGKSLRERFQDDLIFDPIVVEPAIDHDGVEYLDIFIIYEGDFGKLDPDWSSGLSMLLRPDLLSMGIASVPSHSFVPRSDWKEVFKEKHPRSNSSC